ncbi:MSHA biogenesis protein MshK [Enterovibrio sp. 27052020O]|uniref:MSHA biogenesis protein MshK n=1 Tax=Enterovibrio sp. 27052020O TaxID=3241166 RepID=UPI00388D5B80
MKVLNKLAVLFAMSMMPFLVFADNDPTAPLGYQAPSQAKKATTQRLPNLNAILCSSDNRCSAVMNGRSLTAGQSINGYVISAINDSSVTLKRGERRWSLTVFNEQVVQ